MRNLCCIYSLLLVCLSLCSLSVADMSGDCIEVGYARSASGAFHRAYDELKPAMMEKWSIEDETKQPSYSWFSESLKNITRSAYFLEKVSESVLNTIKKTRVGKRCKKDWLLRGLEKHVTPLANLDQQLADDMNLMMSFRCAVGSPYPNVDGTCISSESPDLGAIGAKFLRLLPANPGPDGFSLRTSKKDDDKSPLPSARSVSNAIRKHLKKPGVTALFRDWSHFIQQDLFSIPESPYAESIDCCKAPETEDCAPIMVDKEDPIFNSVKCFNFRRAARAQAILGHRESYSIVSTYLDATPLYGATNENAFALKTNFFGYLKGPEKCDSCVKSCKAPDGFDGCFSPAEDSAFDVPESLHALLILEHNRISDALAELNPHFDDSLLYNEARRIMIAQYASITYGNFLKVLMGEETTEKHFLMPGTDSPASRYIKEVNPGILTSYATLGFRNPSMLTEWSEGSGLSRSEFFSSTHYSSLSGLNYQDILAMDVQRGRDHGLPSYVDWRRFCEPGIQLDSWEDMKKIFSEEILKDLKSVYGEHVEDVDAMVAVLEEPMNGAVAGRTLNCIMADQFARLRTGNRLFWEYEGALFTEEQRQELLKSDLKAVLCSNLPITEVPTNPLLAVSPENPKVECSEVRKLDLQYWKDTSLIEKMKEINEQKQAETPTKSGQSAGEEIEKDVEETPSDQTQTSQRESQDPAKDSKVQDSGAPEVLPVQPTTDTVVGVTTEFITTTTVTTVTVTETREEL